MGARVEDSEKVRSEYRVRLREVLRKLRKKMKGNIMDHLKRQQLSRLGNMDHLIRNRGNHVIEMETGMERVRVGSVEFKDKIEQLIRIHKDLVKKMKLDEAQDKLTIGIHKMTLD